MAGRRKKHSFISKFPFPIPQLYIYVVVAIFLVFLCLHSVWASQRMYVQSQTIKQLAFTSERYKKQLATPTPISYPSISVTPTPLPSTTTHFPHENVPGFGIKIPNGWDTFIKQFRDRDTHGFDNTYTETCAENCMGARISQGAVMLELIFDEAYDSNGMKCSNSVEITTLANGWYRIKTYEGYLYAWKPQRDVTITSEIAPGYNFGKKADEWSLIQDTHYALCLSGYGYFLSEHSPIYPGVDGKGIPLLMEFPKVLGTPSPLQLKQLDEMVSSITGLGTPS